jgi:hypothetical protein
MVIYRDGDLYEWVWWHWGVFHEVQQLNPM